MSVKITIKRNSKTFKVQKVNRTTSIAHQGRRGLQGIQGEKGDTGDQGLQGIQGEQGLTGPIGQQGPKGDQGEKGDKGNQGLQGNTGPKGNKGDQGEAGPRGPQGFTGPQGNTGQKGDQGEQGPIGNPGPKGDPGLTGPTGATGAQGPAGQDGADGADADWSDVTAATSKSTPVDADVMPILDSAASFNLKKLTWANLKNTLKTYNDTLYLPQTYLDTDTALTANSDVKIASQKATKAYADLRIPLTYLDTDGTLAGNSDTKIATQKAVKTYADSLIAANDALVYKGVIDASSNPNYPAASAGHLYKISVAGKIGGASGINVEVGDSILCLVDNTSAGTQASVGANWNIIQVNLDGAVIGPTSSTDNAIARFDLTSGKLIQNSGATIDDSGNITGNNLSGTNTGNETTTTEGALINGATGKTTPVDADLIGLVDSAASNILKKLTWANLKATLKTYFDTLYTKATGAQILTGTDDVNFATSKALRDAYVYPINRAKKMFYMCDDFINNVNSSVLLSTAQGTGGVGLQATDGPKQMGICLLQTGGGSTGGAGQWSSQTNFVDFDTTIEWTYETKIYLSALSNGTDRYQVWFGFIDNSFTESTDGCYFSYKDDVNSGKWEFVTSSNSSRTRTDSGVTVAATTWTVLKVVVKNVGGTLVAQFFINGSQVGSNISSNVPTGTSRVCGYGNIILKTAGTNGVNCWTDYIEVMGIPTSDR